MPRQISNNNTRRMSRGCKECDTNSQFQNAGESAVRSRVLGGWQRPVRWGGRRGGGFWGEQPGAGGTAHFGTVARPTSYYDVWNPKFEDFFSPRRRCPSDGRGLDRHRATARVIQLSALALVPKLCLGTQMVFETLFRRLGEETEFPRHWRSQTEFGNEETTVSERGASTWSLSGR